MDEKIQSDKSEDVIFNKNSHNTKNIKVIKRDGRIVDYDRNKIETAIQKSIIDGKKPLNRKIVKLSKKLAIEVENKIKHLNNIEIEEIQNKVIEVLRENNLDDIANSYQEYRERRNRIRENNIPLIKTFKEINEVDAEDSDIKRDNANIDGSSAMGTMLKYGSESAKDYYLKNVVNKTAAKAHIDGLIHIHDLDFNHTTATCCQIDLSKLLKDGFNTGHGTLRKPKSIMTAMALTAIIIQSNQNDMHGGQSIPAIDYYLAPYVVLSYQRHLLDTLDDRLDLDKYGIKDKIKSQLKKIKTISNDNLVKNIFKENLLDEFKGNEHLADYIIRKAKQKLEREVHQAAEGLIHNLNTLHSRAGAQVPFSSINYGTDTSAEGRMIIKNLLLATEEGLGNGETPIFPIQIFKVKEGVNYNSEDPNYDLFKLAMKVSAKRLFPNFSFIDAPFNLQYYKPGHPETEIAYMGCRTRVVGNVYDKSKEIVTSRGNLSFTSINLPRLAIQSKGSIQAFYKLLENTLDIVSEQLLERYRLLGQRKVKNYPFLMGQGVWLDSDKLKLDDKVGEILKHGTMSIGFIGLAETLVALTGKHHGESAQSQKLGLEIIGYMRKYLDDLSQKEKLNYTLLATPAEGLSGRFVKIDKKLFGELKGITDKEYYTNSFHIPVSYNISAQKKIELEAPYHTLTNAGHITYVELDGDLTKNIKAFEKIIRCMKENNIGYGAINHPIDRDTLCGYEGIIDNICPNCGREENDVKFERIRRITGYLVGTMSRWNDAKKAEERNRVKHGT